MAQADLKLASPAGAFKSAGMETGFVGFVGEGVGGLFLLFLFLWLLLVLGFCFVLGVFLILVLILVLVLVLVWFETGFFFFLSYNARWSQTLSNLPALTSGVLRL